MRTLKSIDGKSLLIGGLLASTIFFAMGATGPTDKWDDEQQWKVGEIKYYQANPLEDESWALIQPKEKLTKSKEWPKAYNNARQDSRSSIALELNVNYLGAHVDVHYFDNMGIAQQAKVVHGVLEKVPS